MMDGHVAATMGEEWSAQWIGQLCARTQLVHQVETIIVVTKTAVFMVDLESVNKRVCLRGYMNMVETINSQSQYWHLKLNFPSGEEPTEWHYSESPANGWLDAGTCDGMMQSPIDLDDNLKATIHAPIEYRNYFVNANDNNRVSSYKN